MSKRRILLVAILCCCFLPVIALALMSFFSKPPSNLGVTDGKLATCPTSPNCVSTQATDEEHRIDSIPLQGDALATMERIRSAIGSMPRAKIIDQRENYIHAEFRSAIFRFVDDVEFFVNPEENCIHFRSASRIGHSDLGANRARMVELTELIVAEAKAGM